jgi:hypothetical protein
VHRAWLSCPIVSRAITRREMRRAGSLGLVGMSLPQLFAAEAAAKPKARGSPAKSRIPFFLEGGPSHIDLWDMKPRPLAALLLAALLGSTSGRWRHSGGRRVRGI